jgi:hypothetical protein
MDNCYLDRFDSHQGAHNVRITNCTLGFGILVIGGGELYIENVHRVSGYGFIHLRMDYNSIFDGDVVIRNCRMGQQMSRVLEGMWISHYNGLPHRITKTLDIDGLVCESDSVVLYTVNHANVAALTDEVNPLYPPERVRIRNVYKADGATHFRPAIMADGEVFASVEYIYE